LETRVWVQESYISSSYNLKKQPSDDGIIHLIQLIMSLFSETPLNQYLTDTLNDDTFVHHNDTVKYNNDIHVDFAEQLKNELNNNTIGSDLQYGDWSLMSDNVLAGPLFSSDTIGLDSHQRYTERQHVFGKVSPIFIPFNEGEYKERNVQRMPARYDEEGAESPCTLQSTAYDASLTSKQHIKRFQDDVTERHATQTHKTYNEINETLHASFQQTSQANYHSTSTHLTRRLPKTSLVPTAPSSPSTGPLYLRGFYGSRSLYYNTGKVFSCNECGKVFKVCYYLNIMLSYIVYC